MENCNVVFGTPRNLFLKNLRFLKALRSAGSFGSKKVCRGQAWGFDLMIGAMVFIAGLIIFFLYALNTPETETVINKLTYDGDIIASTLLSNGFPEDWNEQNAINPGILSDNKINDTKLERFHNFTINNYQKTKSLFNTRYEYFIYLSNNNFTIDGAEIQNIGNSPVNPKNLIKISKVTIYKNKLLTLNIEIWEK